MFKLDIDRLHNTFNNRVEGKHIRGDGNTVLDCITLIGFLEVLEDEDIYVVLIDKVNKIPFLSTFIKVFNSIYFPEELGIIGFENDKGIDSPFTLFYNNRIHLIISKDLPLIGENGYFIETHQVEEEKLQDLKIMNLHYSQLQCRCTLHKGILSNVH